MTRYAKWLGRVSILVAVQGVVGAAGLASSAAAQTLGERLAAVRDGTVAFRFGARPDACGDGRGGVGLVRPGPDGSLDFTGPQVTFRYSRLDVGTIRVTNSGSGWSCRPGPVHVTATMRSGRVAGLRVAVGSPSLDDATRDLGSVAAGEAATYLLGLAEKAVADSVARDALEAFALADSTAAVAGFSRLAAETGLSLERRSAAVVWLGRTRGDGVVEALERIARDAREDRLVGAALMGLAMQPEPEATAQLRTIAVDEGRSEHLRGTAVFWLGQHRVPKADGTDAVTMEDRDFLRSLVLSAGSEDLRGRAIQALSQQEGVGNGPWLADLVVDSRQSLALRLKATFWASQTNDAADLVSLYDRVQDRALKERLLFAYSQQDGGAAADKLIAVARSERDAALRKRAIFWLGQSGDPRAAVVLRELISR